LGDIFGRKRIYLLGVLGFGLTSLGCGLAPTASTLIIMRILQGIFGALLVPGALAIINTAFPRQKRGAAIASWSAWMAIFPPIGPLLGGYILDIASWRWIFLINVPLLAVCYLLAHFGAPESRDPIARKIDGQGAALAALSLAGLTYGLIQGPATHWNAQAWWSLLIGLTAALLWWRQERQTTDPMVPLKLFRSRNFSGANIMTFLLYGALGGILFVLVIYLQRQLHYSSLQAGVSTLPIPICIFFLSRYFSELCRRYGPRLLMSIGPLLVGFGILSLWFASPGTAYLTHIFPGVLLFGLGMSVTVAPLTITVMSALSEVHSGIASAINNALARVSGLLVVAGLGILGSDLIFHFAVVLCGALAILGGIISWLTIVNPAKD
jgi:EmrB/QacA subfamily drug resistance transporter